jgi:hypothetical protein
MGRLQSVHGKNGVYDGNVEILAITEIYGMSFFFHWLYSLLGPWRLLFSFMG